MLVFLAVTLGLAGGYLALSGYWQRDASRVRRRLVDEFGTDEPKVPPSTLYKNLDPLKLDLGQAPLDPLDLDRPPSRQDPSPGLRDRLDGLLEQANLALTVNQLLAAAAILACVLGSAGTWFGGLLTGFAAAGLGAAAPVLFVHWRRRS